MKRLIGFVDPVRAGAEGIASRSIVGGFTPERGGRVRRPLAFRVNPEFLAALTDYMNGEPSRSDEIVAQAREIPSCWLYIIDPRDPTPDEEDPPATDVLGCYAVDEAGQVVPNSFQYNSEHLWFCTAGGVSGMLEDRTRLTTGSTRRHLPASRGRIKGV